LGRLEAFFALGTDRSSAGFVMGAPDRHISRPAGALASTPPRRPLKVRDQSGEGDGRAVFQIGPMICTPMGRPDLVAPIGAAVAGRLARVAMPGHATWAP